MAEKNIEVERLRVSDGQRRAMLELPDGTKIKISIDRTKRVPVCSVNVKNPSGFVCFRPENMQINWGEDELGSTTAFKFFELPPEQQRRLLESKDLFAIFDQQNRLVGIVKNHPK
ncbi:MAG: hypothetical protein HYW15_00275 [Candidatus Giovannonibacteria bacterium]|nr:MAG: hypothetical protein HYW15_00275 [Candidatus Giovannonibacteria bacterium]